MRKYELLILFIIFIIINCCLYALFCPECGHENTDDAKFCIKCGKKLPTTSREESKEDLFHKQIREMRDKGISEETIQLFIEAQKKIEVKDGGQEANISYSGNILVYVKTIYGGRVKAYLKEGDIWKQRGFLSISGPMSSWTLAMDIEDVKSGLNKIRLEFKQIDDKNIDDVIIPCNIKAGKYLVIFVELVEEKGEKFFSFYKILWRVKEAYYADMMNGKLKNKESILTN